MRSLSSVSSADYIIAQVKFDVTANDGSEEYSFTHKDIVSISNLSWEIPFMGGFGKPSVFDITISTSLGFIHSKFSKLVRASSELIVDVNADRFTPHAGRIRSIQRNAQDPNLLTFKIYDEILDKNPRVPVESLVESYSNLHPDVIDHDISQGLYYGKHTRPFFHTPVDCAIGSLLGPRNVSSANHVNSVFYNSKLENTSNVNEKHIMMMPKIWEQQSGASNVVSGGYEFEVQDISPMDTRIWNYQSSFVTDRDTIQVQSEGSMDFVFDGYIQATAQVNSNASGLQFRLTPVLANPTPNDPFAFSKINYSAVFSNYTTVRSHSLFLKVDSGNGTISYEVSGVTSNQLVGSTDIRSTDGRYILNNMNQRSYFEFILTAAGASGLITATTSVSMNAMYKSHHYRNYSIFSPIVNSSDIALSENPIRILEDIFTNQTSTSYQQDQSSSSQVDTSSYNMQCGFYERTPLNSIIDEFGKITATYMWIGDNGRINYRTYTESASAVVDKTITTSDMYTLTLRTDQIGLDGTEKVRAINVKYDYNFQTQKYDQVLRADKINTAMCNSISSIGVEQEKDVSTKYIKETDTASYYLGNLVRRYCQGDEFADLKLPARFFDLELADIIKIEHPSIVNSSALYQVVAISPDYIRGTVSLRAGRLEAL